MSFKEEKFPPLSLYIKKLVFQMIKGSGWNWEGFTSFKLNFAFRAIFDEEECDKILETMMINKTNVLRYLERKYIPTYKDKYPDTIFFLKQKCIQKVKILKDKSLFIYINNSETHKIITDTNHVINMLREQGLDIPIEPKLRFKINTLKLAEWDIMLYNTCSKDFGYSVPYNAKMIQDKVLWSYGSLEKVISIKMTNQAKKILRWKKKLGIITDEQMRRIIKFQPKDSYIKIKKFAKQIKEEIKQNGKDWNSTR